MKPLYIIVHGSNLPLNRDISLLNHDFDRYEECLEVIIKLDRIKKDEEFIEILGDSGVIPNRLSKTQPILVCGAYLELCVENQYKALKSQGYNAEIYLPGTLKRPKFF